MTQPAFGDEGPTTTVAPPTTLDVNFSLIDQNARQALTTNAEAQRLATIPPDAKIDPLARKEFLPNLIKEVAEDPVAAVKEGGNALLILTGIGRKKEEAQHLILELAKLYIEERKRLENKAISQGIIEGMSGEQIAAALTGHNRTGKQQNDVEGGDESDLVRIQADMLYNIGENLENEEQRKDMVRGATLGGFSASAIFAADRRLKRFFHEDEKTEIEEEEGIPDVSGPVALIVRANMEQHVNELREALEAAKRGGKTTDKDKRVLAAEKALANLVSTHRAARIRQELMDVIDKTEGQSDAERKRQFDLVKEEEAHHLLVSQQLYAYHLKNVVPTKTPKQTFG
jgi:hypothetical protein